MTSLLLLLLGTLASVDPEPLRPAAVVGPDRAPRVVHLAAPASPAVSLRLTVPFEEGPDDAGAGLVLEALARTRVEAALRPVGARSSVERTTRGLVVTVTGSRTHVGELLEALRVAVAPPEAARIELIRARSAARAAAARHVETPRDALLSSLRDRVLPELPPVLAPPEAIDELDRAALESFWARTHAPERMSLVVAGALDPAEISRALRNVGSPAADAAEPPERSRRLVRPDPETLRHWYAQAWPAGSPEDPRAAVVARLVSSRVRIESRGGEIGVEVWEIGGRNVLVVAGAAYPSGAAALRRRVTSVLPDLESELGAEGAEEAVRAAAAAVRRDLLHRARSVEGAATVVGRSLDSTGDPEAAWRFLESLERIDAGSLADFLGEVLSLTPLRQELRP